MRPTHQSINGGYDVVAWRLDPSSPPPPWLRNSLFHRGGQWIHRYGKVEVVAPGTTGDWAVMAVEGEIRGTRAYLLRDEEFKAIFRELNFSTKKT